jgi:hypothetical protein
MALTLHVRRERFRHDGSVAVCVVACVSCVGCQVLLPARLYDGAERVRKRVRAPSLVTHKRTVADVQVLAMTTHIEETQGGGARQTTQSRSQSHHDSHMHKTCTNRHHSLCPLPARATHFAFVTCFLCRCLVFLSGSRLTIFSNVSALFRGADKNHSALLVGCLVAFSSPLRGSFRSLSCT